MARRPSNPQDTVPMAPAAPVQPSGVEPPESADEGAMAAGMAAGPQAGPAEQAAMHRPPHNIKKAPMPPYGPATS